MNTFLLGMTFLAGCGETTDRINEQRTLDGCFATLFPKDEWNQEVAREWSIINEDDNKYDSVEYIQDNYYHNELRHEVINYLKSRWEYKEQLFLCSSGLLGKPPPPWKPLNTAEFVRDIGRSIPKLLTMHWSKL